MGHKLICENMLWLALIPWKSTFGQYYYQPCHLHPIWVFAQKVQICCQKIHEWSQSGAREQILNFDVSLKMLPLRKQIPMLINKLCLVVCKRVGWSRNHRKLRLKLDISVKKTAILSAKRGVLAKKSARFTGSLSKFFRGMLKYAVCLG